MNGRQMTLILLATVLVFQAYVYLRNASNQESKLQGKPYFPALTLLIEMTSMKQRKHGMLMPYNIRFKKTYLV